MIRARIQALLGLLIITALVLAACAAPADQTPADTQTDAPPATDGGAVAPEPDTTAPDTTEPDTAAQPGTSVEVAEDSYRVGIFEQPSTLNYWSALGPNTTVWNSFVLGNHRVGLYGLAPQTFEIVPMIAAELPERPLTQEGEFYVAEVQLKEGVTWSDGTPLTANDVAFTLNTVLELGLPGNWVTAADPNFLDRVEAVDDLTVRYYYIQEPGLGVHEFGTLQAAIMSEAYWSPIIDEAREAVAAAPAATEGDEEEAAETGDTSNPLNVLYNHTPQNEPVVGPFQFARQEPGAFVENEINENYFFQGSNVTIYADGSYSRVQEGVFEDVVGDAASPEQLSFTEGPFVESTIYSIYGSQDAAVLALRNGEIDYIQNSLGLQRGLLSQVQGQPGIDVIENPTNGFRYLGFNTRSEPMSETAFRQAVAVLIDKEFITGEVLQGDAYPLYTFVPEGNAAWYTDDVPKFGLADDGTTPLTRGERLEQAIQILQDGGFSWEGDNLPTYDAASDTVTPGGRLLLPNGEPVPSLELLHPTQAYDPLRATFGTWTERWLNEAGIPVNAAPTEFNQIIDRVVVNQDFDMVILGWSLAIFPNHFYNFFHSERAAPGDQNSGGYSDPEYDAIAERIRTCTSFEECKEVADEAQRYLATELPYVLLFDTGIIEAYSSEFVEFPFTETLSGIQFTNGPNGAPNLVQLR